MDVILIRGEQRRLITGDDILRRLLSGILPPGALERRARANERGTRCNGSGARAYPIAIGAVSADNKTAFNARRMIPSLARLAALAAGWWIITEGATGAWLIGLPAIVLTSILLARTASHGERTLRLAALPGFVIFFIAQSFRGGTDIARRAVSPHVRLQPAVVPLQWHLPQGAPRTMAIVIMNLLPGTLAVEDQGRHADVHVVDNSESVGQEMRHVETRVAALFGLELSSLEEVR